MDNQRPKAGKCLLRCRRAATVSPFKDTDSLLMAGRIWVSLAWATVSPSLKACREATDSRCKGTDSRCKDTANQCKATDSPSNSSLSGVSPAQANHDPTANEAKPVGK